MLHLERRRLNRGTALGFAPGTHAFIDRLRAHLDGRPLPSWQERYKQTTPDYPPSWVSRTPRKFNDEY